MHVSVPSDVSRAAVEAQPLLPADPAPGADADDFRPTLERALALKAPAVIEIAVDYRENLPLVQPMRLRAVD